MNLDKIKPFLVMEILEKAQEMQRTGKNVIHLEVGEPDFDTPKCIVNSTIEALREGKTKYTHSLGLIELKKAIVEYYYQEYQVEILPEQVIVTSGTSPALFLLFTMLLEKDDEVILPDPYYPCYPNFINLMKATPVYYKLKEREGYTYDIDSIRRLINKKSKALIINSPSNPTGMVNNNILKDLADLDIHIVSDEIYHGLTYGIKAKSILEYKKDAFVLNGFSKKYAMTGWRLGYLIVPQKYVRSLQTLSQSLFISANEFVQYGGISALKLAQEDVNKMVEIYNRRRIYLVNSLRKLGFIISKEPNGAFYVLADSRNFNIDSFKFAYEILDNTHVAVTPGVDFSETSNNFIRFSYANSIENIQEAIERLRHYFRI
ncbi:MAG: pyridoxal phosphate-dependent aminotransferase [bacterium]|nr:pyridoxal phosphate-dependent aminotransferase [bacterium]